MAGAPMANRLKDFTAKIGLVGLLMTPGVAYAQEAPTENVTAVATSSAESMQGMPIVYLPQGRPSELFISNSFWGLPAEITLTPQCERATPIVASVAPKGSTRIVPPNYWTGCPVDARAGGAITITSDIDDAWLHLASRNPLFTPSDAVTGCDKAYLASPGTYNVPFGPREWTMINLFAPEKTFVYVTAYDSLGHALGNDMHEIAPGYTEMSLDRFVRSGRAIGPNGQLEITVSGPTYVGSTRHSTFQPPVFEKAKPVREPGPGIFGCDY